MEAMTVREWAKSGFSPLAHARGSERLLSRDGHESGCEVFRSLFGSGYAGLGSGLSQGFSALADALKWLEFRN